MGHENGGEYSHRHDEAYLMQIDIVVDLECF